MRKHFLIFFIVMISFILLNVSAFAGTVEEWNGMGIDYYNMGDYVGAVDCFEEAIKILPNSPQLWLNKAISFYAMGNDTEGRKCIKKVMDLSPEFIDNMLNAAHLLIKKGDLSAGKGEYEKAIEYYEEAIKVAMDQKIINEAMSSKKEALKLKEEQNKILAMELLAAAHKLYEAGKYEEAIENYNRVVELTPSDKEAVGRRNEAEETLKNYVQETLEALVATGDRLYNQGKLNKALKHYDRALEIDPEYEEALKRKSAIEKELKIIQKYNMVLIPGGTFQMGSENGNSDEKPVHTAELSPFYMGKFEVTQKEYCEFLNINGNQEEEGDSWKEWGRMGWGRYPGIYEIDDNVFGIDNGYESKPVYLLTWYGAVAYCNWLSDKYGYSRCYGDKDNRGNVIIANNGFRLPTEAEWEYACKAKTESKYYWGEEMDHIFCNNCFSAWTGGTIPDVGCRFPNNFDLYDMNGSMWEWCSDWYGDYQEKKLFNPIGPTEGSEKVVRGGGLASSDKSCTSTHREGDDISYNASDTGFRLVKSLNLISNEYKSNIEKWNSILSSDPENIIALRSKGHVLFMEEKYEDAIDCYNKVLAVKPEDFITLIRKANALELSGDYKEASLCYEKALLSNQEDDWLWTRKGDMAFELEEYEEAIRCYDKALNIDSEKGWTWYDSGEILKKLGSYNGAEECLLRTLNIDPKHLTAEYVMEDTMRRISIINNMDNLADTGGSGFASFLGVAGGIVSQVGVSAQAFDLIQVGSLLTSISYKLSDNPDFIDSLSILGDVIKTTGDIGNMQNFVDAGDVITDKANLIGNSLAGTNKTSGISLPSDPFNLPLSKVKMVINKMQINTENNTSSGFLVYYVDKLIDKIQTKGEKEITENMSDVSGEEFGEVTVTRDGGYIKIKFSEEDTGEIWEELYKEII